MIKVPGVPTMSNRHYRVLKTLYDAGRPLTRPAVVARSGVFDNQIGGILDNQWSDNRYDTLVQMGFIRKGTMESDGRFMTTWTITPKGEAAYERIKRHTNSNE